MKDLHQIELLDSGFTLGRRCVSQIEFQLVLGEWSTDEGYPDAHVWHGLVQVTTHEPGEPNHELTEPWAARSLPRDLQKLIEEKLDDLAAEAHESTLHEEPEWDKDGKR